ncbi:endonuclease/exonuclease/phosphatase family protein [Allomuricauda sp. SCSIO 65647]|uniref:endonuclease/exonuclease/phosphatase family protein n=1 Tax=Allomuricauda sp. SCSIO 65647 TaxID=2908843 RepID=UPI001F40E5BB|nr:endonuclease/exonuclease/phosphatase family protein [Muricauda sp. SCSIO 65647]UJH66358.1 endonuclease/exonuclease/phosphatase family protein [Muricauda sp. SCSIO 65647]
MKQLTTLWVILTLHTAFGQTTNVMTYNIKYDNPKDSLNNWNDRKDFLISQLNFYAPDIFGTQEGLAHQLKEIDRGLNDHTFFGVGRDHGDDRGEFTAIFYNQKKIDLLKEATFWLSPTPEKPSKGWDAALPRICTYGLFKRKKDGRQFYVFNTHFDHVGIHARIESAKLILKKIKELNVENLPVVVMGDFNLEPSSKGIRLISDELGDAHIEAGKNAHGPKGTFNGFDFTKPVEKRIDYIFISNGDFEVLKSGILSDSFECRYPSDHFPVYAELRFMEK